MRKLMLGLSGLMVLSACGSPPPTTEELRQKLYTGTKDGKAYYTAMNLDVHANRSLEEAAQRNTFQMETTCPEGYTVIDIKESDPYSRLIPGTTQRAYYRHVFTEFSCL